MNPELKLNPEQQRIFDSVPDDKPRSRLEAYRNLILRWRRQGRSYRRIQQILADECHVRVSDEAVRRFVKRRARPRDQEQEPEPALPHQPSAVIPAADPPATERRRLTPEEKAAQVEFIRSLRKKPMVVPASSKPLFDYDPDKPLTIDRTRKD